MRKPRLVLVAGAALVFVVAIVGSLVADESEGHGAPPLAAPARNGLIAYSYDGDIYVGDPASGETTAIVTNPRYEVNPVFSPDGQRIAFIRGNPQTGESTIVVVRADGSQERVILPKGREHRGFGVLAWTPDGTSLVAQLDRPPFTYPYGDGELSLFDSFGSGREQVLAPPLVLSIGGHYFSTNHQVAPMFRPPSGDQVLGSSLGDELEVFGDELEVFDRDLTRSSPLGRDLLKPYEPFLGGGTWSPDGTRILVELSLYEETPTRPVWKEDDVFVMSADGGALRRITTAGFGGQWSPDGSRIAFERKLPESDRGVLVVLEVDSGKEHVLESTSAPGKEAGAKFPTVTYNNVVHHWFYEGWMWAPDGRSLLALENHRTHPWVVDIDTDTVTELPWLADSMPSWQRVPSE